MGFLCLWSGDLWADDQANCPTKIVDAGIVEGVLLDADWTEGEDNAYILIKQDNGEEFYAEFEGEATDNQPLFKQIGHRLSVSYRISQYWHEGGESCTQTPFLAVWNIVK